MTPAEVLKKLRVDPQSAAAATAPPIESPDHPLLSPQAPRRLRDRFRSVAQSLRNGSRTANSLAHPRHLPLRYSAIYGDL